jgi:hypothetical protein
MRIFHVLVGATLTMAFITAAAADVLCTKQEGDAQLRIELNGEEDFMMMTVASTLRVKKLFSVRNENQSSTFGTLKCKIDGQGEILNSAICEEPPLSQIVFEKIAQTGLFDIYEKLNVPNLSSDHPELAISKIYGKGYGCKIDNTHRM